MWLDCIQCYGTTWNVTTQHHRCSTDEWSCSIYELNYKNFMFLLIMYTTPLSLYLTLLRLVALQPPVKRLVEEVATRLAQRNRGPEIVAMLRVLEHVAENLVLVLLLTALGRLGEGTHARRKGLCGQRGERAPRVEFTTRPVKLARADVPAAEDGVGGVGAWPVGEEGLWRCGELTVADVGLVLEGVVFGDELVGAEVCGLEVACR